MLEPYDAKVSRTVLRRGGEGDFSPLFGKTVFRGKTTLAFLKQIFDKKSENFYDWAFATNQSAIDLDYIIPTYKKRWRIETGFRVQDEARISSKSIDPRIRFFFFAYEQILQLLWIVLYKEG